jgi:YD repeat-containing protein
LLNFFASVRPENAQNRALLDCLDNADPNNNVTHYTYDALDRLSTVTDPANRVTTYGYDNLGRQTSVADAAIQNGPLVAYAYTANGKRLSLTDANGHLTTYVYDGLDRLSQSQFPNSDPALHTSDTANYEAVTSYDANRNPLVLRKRDGTLITLTYDALNQVTKKAYPGDVNDVFLSYDLAGRVTQVGYNSATGPGVVYGYDTAGRLTSEATSLAPAAKTMSYAYDAAGNRTSETWPDAFQVTYGYDSMNRMTTVTEAATSTVLATYGYDSLSRRSSLSRSNGSSTAWGYDPANLTSLTQAMPAGQNA